MIRISKPTDGLLSRAKPNTNAHAYASGDISDGMTF